MAKASRGRWAILLKKSGRARSIPFLYSEGLAVKFMERGFFDLCKVLSLLGG